ncbi:hypothetical protein [Mesorhizobium sp. M2A.F.Ca.ET.067.02.1.1]|uniref:sugar ABC transporter permease n=1 Tax=Mesorhizobium sp. M2A.F.Ca.ET.067.02.1.1 TaxID=2496749 RepID=UPI000FD353A0|nr:hypothetical protein [Mesorhizobium sp. M2A.F.Ca.ET.067.02.1.1]RUW70017.1 hypothetical protein EOA28_24495 [Mesorhizobium sp. M2A.F.Ca.ET.067.02.1.1]TIU58025.1 MAG: hypothetical protein E5W35_06365 [Mesorhizobium sp.]
MSEYVSVMQPANRADVRASDIRNTSLAATIRDLRLVILFSLTAIAWVVFHFATGGYVLTARNLSILSVQMSVTAIVAIGMTLLLIAKEIDLSAGAAMALIIVVIFQLQVEMGASTLVTICAALALGAAIGVLHGLVRVWLTIPSFIITLAGVSWIRGVAFLIPDAQTLSGLSNSFHMLANSQLPPIISGALVVTIGLVLVSNCITKMRAKQSKLAISRTVERLQFALVILLSLGSLWVFTSYRGLPYPTLFLIVLTFVFHWVTRGTDFGRYVYAIGGNAEAAKRVGINVNLITVLLFVIMGLLTAIAAIVQGSLLDAAPPGIGDLLALNAISAAIIGGTNLFGGQGSMVGTVAGAALMASIANGLSLLGVNSFTQMVATGAVLLFAVGIDALTAKKR